VGRYVACMRRGVVAVVLALCVFGGIAYAILRSDGGVAGPPLAYLPEDAGLVVVLSTDLESEQIDAINRTLGPRAFQGSDVESLLRTRSRRPASRSTPT
jgi:hypothetical protein